MREAPIVEVGIREVSTYCEFADFAYASIDRSGGQEALQSYFYIHSFLSHCAMVARLLWSSKLAEYAGGRTIGEILELPQFYRINEKILRGAIEDYDLRLAHGLQRRGDIRKILDYNIGDRDAFEEEQSLFLRHYDPSVDTLTLLEEEFNLTRIATELADVRSRAETWLDSHATLVEQPALASIPPVH